MSDLHRTWTKYGWKYTTSPTKFSEAVSSSSVNMGALHASQTRYGTTYTEYPVKDSQPAGGYGCISTPTTAGDGVTGEGSFVLNEGENWSRTEKTVVGLSILLLFSLFSVSFVFVQAFLTSLAVVLGLFSIKTLVDSTQGRIIDTPVIYNIRNFRYKNCRRNVLYWGMSLILGGTLLGAAIIADEQKNVEEFQGITYRQHQTQILPRTGLHKGTRARGYAGGVTKVIFTFEVKAPRSLEEDQKKQAFLEGVITPFAERVKSNLAASQHGRLIDYEIRLTTPDQGIVYQEQH